MDDQGIPRKSTDAGVDRGDVAAIARRTGVSMQHVSLCVRGERIPGPKLAAEINRVRALRAAQRARRAEREQRAS